MASDGIRTVFGGRLHGHFTVTFHEEAKARIRVAKIEPWLDRSWGSVLGRIEWLDAMYWGPTGEDGIRVIFCCGPWEGEAILDRDQASKLHSRLGQAIADYDSREPARQPDSTCGDLFPEVFTD
jgi:hypothetical protein